MADIIVAGNTSGAITISAPLVAGSGVLTLPTGTDTLIGKATTDTLTNKTLTSPILTSPALGAATATSLTVSGDVLITSASVLGYSTGSGGTVTQATSKTTAVTLNKPSGLITLNNASLAASTTVEFTFNNSLITSGDSFVFSIIGNTATAAAYNIGTRGLAVGSIVVGVRNITAGSLSEGIEIRFALIRGATS